MHASSCILYMSYVWPTYHTYISVGTGRWGELRWAIPVMCILMSKLASVERLYSTEYSDSKNGPVKTASPEPELARRYKKDGYWETRDPLFQSK